MAFIDAVEVDGLVKDLEGEAAGGRDMDSDDVGSEAGTFGGECEMELRVRIGEDAGTTAVVDADLTGEGRV